MSAGASGGAAALELIRLLGSEFSGLSDSTLEQWIEALRPLVSRKQFGALYEQALALLVCHRLKLAGYGDSPLGELGAAAVGFGVGSVSEGGSTISYGTGSSTTNVSEDAEYGLTIYGTQYLTLRRSVIVPIHTGGER